MFIGKRQSYRDGMSLTVWAFGVARENFTHCRAAGHTFRALPARRVP
jgi:hypothetical protein